MNLNSTLLKWRIQNRKSQQELADELGVSQSTLHKWESNKSEIPLRLYSKICRHLDFSLKSFLPSEMVDHLFLEDESFSKERGKYIQLLEDNNRLLKQLLEEVEKGSIYFSSPPK